MKLGASTAPSRRAIARHFERHRGRRPARAPPWCGAGSRRRAARRGLPPGGPARTAVRRRGGAPRGEADDAGATQVIPRVDRRRRDDALTPLETPIVGAQRGYHDDTGGTCLPSHAHRRQRLRRGAPTAPRSSRTSTGRTRRTATTTARPAKRHGADPVRHAYYPGRRMNLGVVLLPLRIFLGFISIYAGMGKLCDPVYFDGGERGSMVKWLNSLHPWDARRAAADFALSAPRRRRTDRRLPPGRRRRADGARPAGSGSPPSSARCCRRRCSSPSAGRPYRAYDAPDIIYLAAWSPLIIAGAPVYSVDGRLAGEAWRRLGPALRHLGAAALGAAPRRWSWRPS